ncbi:MAG: ribosome biogenesis GTPase Der [Candidatus Rokubacteria bacterium]|nr:ribosome biogenesis GTPase Der [Candidatus Rokubacteria bacterium]
MSRTAPPPRPIIAIVGRPNVGKSTLFNRLVGHRRSLVRDVPGVTRDRLYGVLTFERWQATVVDTGGFDPASEEPLVVGVRRHVLAAVEEADLVVFVVDTRAGMTALDEEIARLLRRSRRPVVVAANKVDAGGQESALAEFHRLGFGEPVPISAEHGRGVAEMLDVLRERTPPEALPRVERTPGVRVAIIGRPNVGKSSLVNALVGDDRVLVHDQPGTTRDTVDTMFVHEGRTYVLLDTAGIRRKGRVSEPLEKLAVVMALKGLERSDVAVLVIDAAESLAAQDAHIAGYAHDAGRAIVLAVNKWDLLADRGGAKAAVTEQVRERLTFVDYAPIVFTSAARREGLDELLAAVDHVAAEAEQRLTNHEATSILKEAIARRPFSIRGVPLTLHSVTQVAVRPPTFVARVNRPDELHFSYERYLLKSIRHAAGFAGSPIRLIFRRAPRPRRVARQGEG